MEQTMRTHARKAGWTDSETNLLWETAEEAGHQGIALKAVFEKIAQETGRRPNSIRNYYYAQVRQRMGGAERAARFVPFGEKEVLDLLEHVLRDRAEGKSVRSCLQRISSGDHSLMLRYQNKYRSVIKSRPELVRQVVDKLQAEGLDVKTPEVKTRAKTSLTDTINNLTGTAQQQGDPELVRALETIGDYLLGSRSAQPQSKGGMSVKLDLYRMALDEQRRAQSDLSDAALDLIAPIKEFLALDGPQREGQLEHFARAVAERIGAVEECLVAGDEG